MRRLQIQMTPEEIRVYLRNSNRLIAVSNGLDGYPHPMPLNFVLDDRDHYLATTFRKSQKVKNFERDPKAALLVESGTLYHELKSVLAYATTDIITDTEQVLEILDAIAAKEAGGDAAKAERLREHARHTAPKRVALRFKPESYVSWDHAKLNGAY